MTYQVNHPQLLSGNRLKIALEKIILQQKESGLHRQRRITTADPSMLCFSSNDYLSLSTDLRLKNAYQRGFSKHAVGSGGSMLVCGYHSAHRSLEQAFAGALKVDDCVLFSSGYAANLSVAAVLSALNTLILMDQGMHASMYDGLRLAGADYVRYRHHNLQDLLKKMQANRSAGVILTESVFSMSGQISDLSALCTIAKIHEHSLIIDEAHAFGVLGAEGLGGVIHAGLTQQDVPLRVIPLGKAFAAFGAVVAGDAVWIDALLQIARPDIYSTSVSPAVAYGLEETLDIMRNSDDRRSKLTGLVNYFRTKTTGSKLIWRESYSPIQQLQLGCAHRALHYAQVLKQQGIICLPMRPPTVSVKDTGLRVILNYDHMPQHIDRLFECLDEIEDV